MKLGRNKNKDSSDFCDAVDGTALPPPLPMPSDSGYVNKLNEASDGDASPASAVVPAAAKSPAPHLYAEIIVPTKKRRPSRYHHSKSTGYVDPSINNIITVIDSAESNDNGDNVSLAFTSVSSMTGRSSLFGPISSTNHRGGENVNNGTMPPPYQNLLSSLLWCPLGGGHNGASGGDGVGTLKETEVEDYFDYSNMNGVSNGVGGVMKEQGGDLGLAGGDEDDGIIVKLLGAWNETFNSTCQCFEIGDGVVEGNVSNVGRGVDDSSSSKTNGVGTPTEAKTSGKRIASSGDTGLGLGEATTANDTSETLLSKRSSHHSLQKVPTFSEPVES